MAELEARKQQMERKDVQFGKGPDPGTAGPDGIYILRQLERWRARGDGILKQR